MLEMGTKRSSKIMMLGKDEEHNKAVFLWFNEADQHMTSRVPHGVAVRMFDECLKWLEEQEEASVYNISILHNLRKLASRKRLNELSQTRIENLIY